MRALFKQAGIQPIETETTCGKLVYGYYSCNAPPSIGFNIGGSNFDFESKALEWKDDGSGNCTAIITGFDKHPEGSWLVGQAWMQGKYIDHNSMGKSMGFAKLKDPSGAAN